eukprot:639132-Prymnesium_polylepis.1
MRSRVGRWPVTALCSNNKSARDGALGWGVGGRTEAPATPRRAGVTCDSASAGGQSRRAARA